jgi:hypothetical protein
MFNKTYYLLDILLSHSLHPGLPPWYSTITLITSRITSLIFYYHTHYIPEYLLDILLSYSLHPGWPPWYSTITLITSRITSLIFYYHTHYIPDYLLDILLSHSLDPGLPPWYSTITLITSRITYIVTEVTCIRTYNVTSLWSITWSINCHWRNGITWKSLKIAKVIRSLNWTNDRRYNGQRWMTKGQTFVDEILHVKLKITSLGPLKIGVNSEAQQGKTVPSSLVAPVVLPMLNIRW